jgi:dipeptidyl aminopeptidase/acylaminoacyl peptidase
MADPKTSPRSRRVLDVPTLLGLQRLGPPTLAPDGRAAVCTLSSPSIADNRSTTRLWWMPWGPGEAPRPLTHAGEKDAAPAFAPDGRHVAFIARREQGGRQDDVAQLYLMPSTGGEARRITDWAPGVEAFRWHPDGRHIVFSAWVRPGLKGSVAQHEAQKKHRQCKESGVATGEAFHRHWDHEIPPGRALQLHWLDTASGRIVDLFEGTAFELPRDSDGPFGWSIAPDGRSLVFEHDPAPVPLAGNRLALARLLLPARGKPRIQALLDDARWSFFAPSHGPTGSLAFLAAEVGRHHMALAEPALLDPRSRRSWRRLAAGWDHEANAPLRWTADGGALLFTAEERGRCHLWQLALGQANGVPEALHRGGWVQGFDVAGTHVVVLADGADHPARLLALEAGTAPRRIERFNDKALAGIALGGSRELTLPGAKGAPVQVWLSLPPGFGTSGNGRRWPVLHVVHGGPHTAAGDTFSYRWNTQLMAAWGFVVVQVNFHGSSGFGFEFRRSLQGRQGQLETADIEATTDWLRRQRWVDPQRIFASGGSYGGFLVAWMNSHVPAGRYRAYVCHAGVFDRVATFAADSWPTRPKDLGARWWRDMPKVLAQSPHASAARMATPTLVIHGALDYRVPDCNGLAHFHTLQALGVPARLLWFPDENHWVLKPANAAQWYREFEDWLRVNDAKR